MNTFIDTHAHLFLPEFENDRKEVIQQAINKGITKIILPNIDSGTLKSLLNLSSSFPGICLPAIGLHPTSVKAEYKSELQFMEDNIQPQKFIAIGEIGLDQYWDKTYLKEQIYSFEFQVELACRNHLPVIIHSRETIDDLITILSNLKSNKPTGVFHSFAGTLEQAEKIIDLGFYLGINGIVTYKNSKLAGVLAGIDLKHIVLETDSPYLPPVPKRGMRNESSFLLFIAEKIAEIKKISMEEVAEITTKNATELFKL